MTDNKALTRFFQAKQIPPKLWNHCDRALQFDFILAHVPGTENVAADYLSRLDIRPEERVHLKLHDKIPVHHIEVDLASKTPKQDEDEEDFDPTSLQQQDDHTNLEEQHKTLDTILAIIPQKDDETDEDFARRKQMIKDQLTPHIVDLPEHECYIKLIKKSSHSTLEVNQVSPSGISDIVDAQKQDLDVQRMVRILNQQEPPPNQVNFTSRFFKKT